MIKTWFTSDTHFGHANIIRLCNRPYANVTEMNDALVSNWNETIAPQDIVYHLGDFAFRGVKNETESVFNKLNGRKILIKGNHDDHDTLNLNWESVHDYWVIKNVKTVNRTVDRLVLFHYPMREWDGWFRGSVHLYGHCHNALANINNSTDVGVDAWNFKPVSLETILNRIDKNAKTKRPL